VKNYFQDKRRLRLLYPHLPCLIKKRGGAHEDYYPLEVINIVNPPKEAIVAFEKVQPRKGKPGFCNPGELRLIMGPMYSGKTSSLILQTDIWKLQFKRVMILHAALDTRSALATVESHDGTKRTSRPVARLEEILDECKDCHVIAIDEAHLLPDIIKGIEILVNLGKIVLVSGLTGFLKRNKWIPFPFWTELVAQADHVDKRAGPCDTCNGQGLYTVRRADGPRLGIVGGKERWTTLCRICLSLYKTKDGQIASQPSFVLPTEAEREYWKRQIGEPVPHEPTKILVAAHLITGEEKGRRQRLRVWPRRSDTR
jgi:thymidine kinase